LKKILVTGSNGQVGNELRILSENFNEFLFEFVDIAELDLTIDTQVDQYLTSNRMDYIINCAAYTAVDKAEEEPELCSKVNAEAVGFIARAAKKSGSRLIHISTDYVFDGEFNQPLDELAKPNPVSVYGKTKLEGECLVQQVLDNAYIIRTAWVYSTFGKNFVKSIINLCRQRTELGVVCDQFGSPTYARDLAHSILHIVRSIDSNKVDAPGTYHFSNEGAATWYDFAYAINEHFGFSCVVRPISSFQYKTAAMRPKFTVLDKAKIRKTFGLQIPHWTASLKECLSKIEP
jgi:dTDP-4-dehydrorhamnose reductase